MKPRRFAHIFVAAFLLATLPASIVFAQTVGDGTGRGESKPGNEEDDIRQLPRRAPPKLKDSTTDGVAAALRQAARFCESIPRKVYTIDCYASELNSIARQLPQSGDYGEARAALSTAATQIETLVTKNADPARPAIKVRSSGARPKTGTRKFRPVKEASLAKVGDQAAAIMSNTQTVLLRSTANSDKRRAHYQRIARSLETGTVMLRSL